MTIDLNHQRSVPRFSYSPIFTGAVVGGTGGAAVGGLSGAVAQIFFSIILREDIRLARSLGGFMVVGGVAGGGLGAAFGLGASAITYGYKRYKSSKVNKDMESL